MIRFFLENAAQSAYLAGISSILGFLALFIFFAGVSVFGPINDAISVFQMLLLVPVFVTVAAVLGERAQALVTVVTIAGCAAAIAIAAMQVLLVAGRVRFEQTLQPILLIGLALGAWWIVTGVLSLSHPAFPAGLSWAGIVCGLSFALIALAYLQWGPYHPATLVGFIAGAIAVPVWAIWLGRLIASSQIAPPIG